MQAAFLAGFVFPPPASRADRFARLDRSRTGLTADGRKTSCVERIHRNPMLCDVGFDALKRPIGQGIDLDEIESGVECGKGCVITRFGLLAPNTCNPPRGPRQSSLEREHLADVAASLPFLDCVSKAENTIARDEIFNAFGIGHQDANASSEQLLCARQSVVGLGEMPSGIEGDRLDFRISAHNGVEENLILQSEARRKNNPPRDKDFYCANARLQIVSGAKRTVERIRKIFAFAAIVTRILDCPVHWVPFVFCFGSRKPRLLMRSPYQAHDTAAVPDGTDQRSLELLGRR